MNGATRLVATVAAVALAGCASVPKIGDPEVAALRAPLIGGFTQIRDKALDAQDIDRLFTAALGRLSVIDPDLHVDVRPADVHIRMGELTFFTSPRPPAQDIGAWTALTEEAVADARDVSALLAAADSEAILQTMYGGVMPLLDPYSRYASRREAARNQITRNGFVGLGLDLEPSDGGARVRLTLKGGPADRAGMLPGDVITHVQSLRIGGQPLPVILRRLEGRKDSLVRLTVMREKVGEMSFNIRRDLIIPETVRAEMQDDILLLTVRSFNQRTAATIAEKVESAGTAKGVIVDLRGDPGGLLDQAVAVADLFLERGVIATLRGRHPGAMQYYAATPGDIARGVPMVVLLDGRSASAAEILAAALQENGRAIAVGTATVGKGSVQTLITLPNGGEIALTWAAVTTPAGALLTSRGVLPDVCTKDAKNAAALLAGVERAGPRRRLDTPAARAACAPETLGPETPSLEIARQLVTNPALRAAIRPADDGQVAATP